MRLIIGFLIVILGILASLYFGGWVMFVGGIVQLVEACKAPVIDSMGIAMGAGRIVLTGFATGIGIFLSVIIGTGIAGMSPTVRRRYR